MKKVLVPSAVLSLNENTIAPLYFLRGTYISKLVSHNLIPVCVNDLMTKEMIDELYDSTDAVMCMGGSDINPITYKKEKHILTEFKEANRDELEIYIIKKAVNDKKPFLGICRGCQVLNIALGGSLNQHIPELKIDEDHGLGEGKVYDDLVTNIFHTVHIDKSSHTYEILKSLSINTNTAHHQSIKELGKDLKISGNTEGGIIEIIEHEDSDYFCFGFQFHPEAMNDEITKRIWTEFVKSISPRL